MNVRHRFSLIEVVISLAFIGVLMIAIIGVVRTLSYSNAEVSLGNQLELSVLRVSTLIHEELRIASAETIDVDSGPQDPVFGPMQIRFQLVVEVDVATGDIWLSEEIQYDITADGRFTRTADGVTAAFGYFGQQGDGVGLGPGLSFQIIDEKTIDFTVRAEALDGEGLPMRRERTVRVSMANK